MAHEEYVSGTTEYRVIYGDTDQMGVVYYANYPRLFERGRGELVRELGLPYAEVEEKGFGLPVTELYCHYHNPAKYDDLLIIKTEVTRLRRASMTFEYSICKKGEEETVLVTGKTIHACCTHEGKIVRVPEFLLEVLGQKK